VLGNRPRARILLEASTESEWVARYLEALGHEVIVADPNYAPMYATRSRRVKTDKRDARALRAMMYGSFVIHHELVPSSAVTHWCPFRPDPLRQPSSPAHSDRPILRVTRRSPRFRYYPAVRRLAAHRFPFRLWLVRSLPPVPPGDTASPPEVTRCSSVPSVRKHPGAVGE